MSVLRFRILGNTLTKAVGLTDVRNGGCASNAFYAFLVEYLTSGAVHHQPSLLGVLESGAFLIVRVSSVDPVIMHPHTA